MLVSKWVPYDAMLLQNALPDVLCVVQVALEGAVSKKAALNSLAQGNLYVFSNQTFRNTSTPVLLSYCLYALAACQLVSP